MPLANTFAFIFFFLLAWPLSAVCGANTGFEATPVPGQTVPRPSDGEVLTANPPCFVFPAKDSFSSYVVEYSPDSKFTPASIRRLSGRWMLNVPEEILAEGTWYWRWRPGRPGDGKTGWSQVRSFIVPASVPHVPFPGPAIVQGRLGKQHPRIMVSADGLEAVRRHALEEFGKTWLDQVKKRAAGAARKQLLPEPAFLPADRHARKVQYQKTFRLYRPFFAEMTRLAEDYLLTGYESAGLEAKRRLLSIMAWDPKGASSLQHNDEVGTELVRHCPRVYDWIYPLLTSADKEMCLEVFQVRMKEVFDYLRRLPFEKRPYESHRMGYFLPDLLLACLAVSGDMDLGEMLHYTMLQLWSPFYPPYGGTDGGWNEGPSYWSWMARVCANTYTLVERLTGVPVRLRSNLRQQIYYKLYANPPWFKMSPFGDGQAGSSRGGDSMLMLAALYGNPYAKWYGELRGARLRGLTALVYPLAGLPARSPSDLPQGRAFSDVGLACSHTDLSSPNTDVAFLLRSSPFGSISHAYADQNTFALDAYGEPLIIASGYYQRYGSPHHVRWTRQTIASNSILIDGKGQPRGWTSRGRLLQFSTLTLADYVVGDAHEAYPGKLDRFSRYVLFLRPVHTGGESIIVVHDEIRAVRQAKVTFLLHALEKMAVDSSESTVLIHRGKAACLVSFLAPDELSFKQDNRFTAPPVIKKSPDQWHLRADVSSPRKNISSVLAIQPYRKKNAGRISTPRLERGNSALAVIFRRARRKVVVVFRTGGAPVVSAASIRTDARAASVTIKEGEVVSALMFGGTFVNMDGKQLIGSTVKGDFSSNTAGRRQHVVEAVLDAPGTLMVQAGFRAIRAITAAGTHIVCKGKPNGIQEMILPSGRSQVCLTAEEKASNSTSTFCTGTAAESNLPHTVTVR